MDEDCLKICERLAGTTYARQGAQALQHHDKRIQQLLVQVITTATLSPRQRYNLMSRHPLVNLTAT